MTVMLALRWPHDAAARPKVGNEVASESRQKYVALTGRPARGGVQCPKGDPGGERICWWESPLVPLDGSGLCRYWRPGDGGASDEAAAVTTKPAGADYVRIYNRPTTQTPTMS
jgi:hypothetical protein